VETKTEQLAATHLGSKQGDYSAYQGIKEVRPDFLVGVPRSENRETMNYNAEKTFGVDVWHGFEVSTLLDNGFPVNFIAVISYPSSTPNIIESKSMKLYWNSFNLAKMGHDYESAKHNVICKAISDLTRCAGGDTIVSVELLDPSHEAGVIPHALPHVNLDVVFRDKMARLNPITTYNDDPSVLESQIMHEPWKGIHLGYCSNSLRSNCRVTKQPDFGDIYIEISGPVTPTPDSLLRYIISMRNEAHFHEEIVERVFSVLHEKFKPDFLEVFALYTRRGGWDINPFRTTDPTRQFFLADRSLLVQRTSRQ